jgi:hypothetical protein
MTTIAYSSVNIQTSAQPISAVPAWFGEITLLVSHLQRQRVLAAIEEQVRFARRRFGRYDVIDFVAVQIALCHQWGTNAGSLLRADRTLGRSFYGALWPRAVAFPFGAQPLSRLT